ncbi:hypothetical protein FVE85_8328 [Porphyridium purpureum]|uniref:Cytochrome c oxidase assembly protein COX20, mitochondrial n=1 Tax=Porphyridium purpureum TaxID=35688 RepID=A0A5J4YKC2_PORPP|nr:hypothetical protein FVE85_8328 [Porphyridium purpureum]|eukprot:POR8907..scf244_11
MENGGADVTEKKGQSDATLNRDLDAGLGSVNPHEGFDEVPRNLENEDLGFLFNLTQVPCFRDTMLYAMPSAAVLAAFRLYRLRDPLRAADLAVKSFTVFTLSGW